VQVEVCFNENCIEIEIEIEFPEFEFEILQRLCTPPQIGRSTIFGVQLNRAEYRRSTLMKIWQMGGVQYSGK